VKQDDTLSGAFVIKFAMCILSWSLIGGILSLPIFAISYDGIAADSFGRVYIGTGSVIHVYDEGVKVNEIGHNKMAGVDFFTIKDDSIYLWNNAYSYVMDLDGNVIEKKESTLGHDILSPKQKRNFVAEDGSHYELKYGLVRWNRIIRTYPDGSEKVVFHMPLWLHLIKMAVRAYIVISVYFIGKPMIMRFIERDR
jgi:hypothetical protein